MKSRIRTVRFGLFVSAASLAAAVSYAAAPAAGSKIGNQASATYTNASGDTISVTSNKVETIVQQVAGLTLVTDNDRTVAPGGKVFMPHTITNDGNGTDQFNLTAVDDDAGGAGDAFDFLNISIFPDADFDGVADSTTPVTSTPVLAAGESFGFVIEATVPGGAAAGTSEVIDVDATSVFDPTVTTDTAVAPTTNLDTVTVSSGPVSQIVKSMTVADTSGDGVTGPGDIVTIELTYSSTGLADAPDMIVTDILDPRLVYVAGSGRWSDVGPLAADALTDGDDGYERQNGNNFQIDYDYDISTADAVTFQVDTVPRGRTATVTFQATIAATAPAGDIPNIATQTVDGVIFPPSNEAIVTVAPVYRVTAADAAATTYVAEDLTADPAVRDTAANLDAGDQSSTDDNGLDDVVVENGLNGAGDDSVFQGGSIPFEFVITNNANVTDTVDLSFVNTSFPAGTTFQLVGADGATPIVGAIGPIPAGDAVKVQIIATLPSNAPVVAGTPGDPSDYEVVLTAQSANGGLANTTTGRYVGAVLGATVDLANTGLADADPNSGFGPGPNDGTTLITTPTDPGVPVSFPLTITNGGPTADTYDLALPSPLPPGWTVEFQLPDGTPITNSGVIPGGGSQDVIVIVTPPADEVPGNTPVQVSIQSPPSGQGDTLTNQVAVNEIVDVALTTDQNVQVAPGGISDIPHVLTNEGNIDLTEGSISAAGDFSTFTGTIFWDVNSDGAVDAGDVVIDNINDINDTVGTFNGLPIGESISLIHRVQVPSNGAIGISEAETLTVGTALNSGTKTDGDTGDNSVTDTVVIVSGDMTLVKQQVLDAGCDGGEALSAFTSQDVQAKPGQCIRYRIVANNTGTEDAGTVTIKDTVPGFTTLTECAAGACAVAVTPAGSTVTQPAEGAGGALVSTHGTLIPGAPASLEFTVKIDE